MGARAIRGLAVIIAAVGAAVAPGGDPLPRATLPAPVAEAVRGLFPRGPIVAVLYDDTDGGREYEAHLKVNGRDAYVVALENGVVLETGLALDEQATPAPVRETLRREAPEGGFVAECFRRELHRAPDGQPLNAPCVFYEITLGFGRDERFLAINADGALRPLPAPPAEEE